MQTHSATDDDHDPDAMSLPGNTKVEKRSKKVGPRQPKRRKVQVENVDS